LAIGDFLRNAFRNPFSFLFTRSSVEEHLVTYVIREHDRGRSLEEILNDRYVLNRTTPQQRARLLDSPELVEAVGKDVAESAKGAVTSGS
jgi:hypothetical protein